MKEIERIIKKGFITEDFLREEVRNGFLVTVDRKKVWAVVLDLLIEFDAVCKKHNIKYFLDGGSLLGAIRHNGFIPWDDDIDVTMPREDYDRFLQLGNEFKYPYFFQTPYTDSGCFYTYAKIRNSNTTALNQLFKYQGFNQGIWITVFPLDKFFLDKTCEDIYSRICQLTYDISTYMRMKNPYLNEKDVARVSNYSGSDPFKTYEEIQKLASQFNKSESDYWGTLVLTIREFKRKALPIKSYAKECYHKFECLELPIPNDYHSVLTLEYGDYMTLPPMEERGGHDSTLFDPDKPYKEYLEGIL